MKDGDWVELDVAARRLELLIPEAEMKQRSSGWQPPRPHYRRGYGRLFVEHVLQAHEGCDFDYLRAV